MRPQDETERTIVAVLNEGLIPFERIIPNNDSAFTLEHKILNSKNIQIVLFEEYSDFIYRMFIYSKKDGVIKEIGYDCMENTWSVYNTLCRFLDKENTLNDLNRKKSLRE